MNTRRALGTLTTSTGAASVNFYCSTGAIAQVFVKPATSSTTFDVTLTDDDNNVVYTRADNTGELNEQLHLPAYLYYTLKIANASADEAHKYIVMIEESW